ncbi:MAG TPA: patatin-like phospholipase family protein [Candidatus Dormibacteraeota bacterium]
MGLALGAGGVLGGAWLAGALAALARETGWDPRRASHLLGTSAGSVFAALLGAGVPVSRLWPPVVADSEEWILARLARSSSYRFPERLPRLRPGSWELMRAGLRHPGGLWPLAKLLAGLVPRGMISTHPIRETVRAATRRGWARHPRCWVVACDYRDGSRVVFGRPGAPATQLADAVAASCSIPGFFQPAWIRGRAYVDGGLNSPSNLDLLAGERLDLVICLNPLSSRYTDPGLAPLRKAEEAVSWLAARQVDEEAKALRRKGTRVVLIEPTAYDLVAIGGNRMDPRRCRLVFEVAVRSVARQLREPQVRSLLSAVLSCGRDLQKPPPGRGDPLHPADPVRVPARAEDGRQAGDRRRGQRPRVHLRRAVRRRAQSRRAPA